ncbi:MAG: VOC family protein [Saonia sp.]
MDNKNKILNVYKKNHGNQIHMNVYVRDSDETERMFDELSEGGQIHNNFKEREWGHFGICTDRFGIGWMVNCNH